MADIFGILNNIYTNPKGDWILELEDSDVVPMVIQRWIVMNDKMAQQARFMDLYTFNVPPRMYLSMLWAITPKVSKPPFIRYIKKKEEEENEYSFILEKVQKQYEIGEKDMQRLNKYILPEIVKDPLTWLQAYGIDKKHYTKFNLDYEKTLIKKKRGLEQWA